MTIKNKIRPSNILMVIILLAVTMASDQSPEPDLYLSGGTLENQLGRQGQTGSSNREDTTERHHVLSRKEIDKDGVSFSGK